MGCAFRSWLQEGLVNYPWNLGNQSRVSQLHVAMQVCCISRWIGLRILSCSMGSEQTENNAVYLLVLFKFMPYTAFRYPLYPMAPPHYYHPVSLPTFNSRDLALIKKIVQEVLKSLKNWATGTPSPISNQSYIAEVRPRLTCPEWIPSLLTLRSGWRVPLDDLPPLVVLAPLGWRLMPEVTKTTPININYLHCYE